MKKLSILGSIFGMYLFMTTSLFSQHFNSTNINDGFEDLDKKSEAEVVISMIKMDLPDYYPSEITASIKKSYPDIPEDRTIRVLPYVREHMITEGKDYLRVKNIADKLLKFMSLQDRVRLIFFDSDVPVTAFTYPYALIVSNAVVDILSDDEIEAVMAHELCHLIVYSNFKDAVESNNLKKQRAIELFCDGVAISIIAAKGKDPEKLIDGLEKMQTKLTFVNNDVEDGKKHPTLKQRKQFFKDLTRKIDIAMKRTK